MDNCTTYRIDRDDMVTEVGGLWDKFAEENGAAGLRASVIGRSIWDFIGHLFVQRLYRELFDATRRLGKPVNVDFRCDSARVLRYMEMRIDPLPDGGLEVQSRLVLEQDRARPLVQDVIFRNVQQGMSMCSRCNSVYVRQLERWMEISEALEGGWINEPLKVVYGMCALCADRLRNQVAEVRRMIGPS